MKGRHVIVIMFVLFACNKQSERNEASLLIKDGDKTKKFVDVCANPSNPYDYFGALHNDGMDYVRTKMKEAGQTKPDAVTKYVQEFAAKKTGQTDGNNYYSLYQRLMKDSAGFYATLIARANLSLAGRQYLHLIFHIITQRATSDTFIYKDVKAEITKIENDILNDTLLPSYDYRELLKACSLARYSSYYWSQNPPKGKSIFGSILDCVVGICADLSALDPICGSFLDWMTGGDFNPISVSSIMYYAL